MNGKTSKRQLPYRDLARDSKSSLQGSTVYSYNESEGGGGPPSSRGSPEAPLSTVFESQFVRVLNSNDSYRSEDVSVDVDHSTDDVDVTLDEFPFVYPSDTSSEKPERPTHSHRLTRSPSLDFPSYTANANKEIDATNLPTSRSFGSIDNMLQAGSQSSHISAKDARGSGSLKTGNQSFGLARTITSQASRRKMRVLDPKVGLAEGTIKRRSGAGTTQGTTRSNVSISSLVDTATVEVHRSSSDPADLQGPSNRNRNSTMSVSSHWKPNETSGATSPWGKVGNRPSSLQRLQAFDWSQPQDLSSTVSSIGSLGKSEPSSPELTMRPTKPGTRSRSEVEEGDESRTGTGLSAPEMLLPQTKSEWKTGGSERRTQQSSPLELRRPRRKPGLQVFTGRSSPRPRTIQEEHDGRHLSPGGDANESAPSSSSPELSRRSPMRGRRSPAPPLSAGSSILNTMVRSPVQDIPEVDEEDADPVDVMTSSWTSSLAGYSAAGSQTSSAGLAGSVGDVRGRTVSAQSEDTRAYNQRVMAVRNKIRLGQHF